MKEEILQFDKFCIEMIRERLEEMEGLVTCGGSLAYKICEPMFANGTFNYDCSLDRQYINEWLSDCGDFYNWYGSEHNHTAPANPFDEPNHFLVQMASDAIENTLSQSKTVTEVWDERFEITEEFTERVMKEIEGFTIKF